MRRTFILFLTLIGIAQSVLTVDLKSSLENLTTQLKSLGKMLSSTKSGATPHESMEKQALVYTNEFRAQQKKPALQWSDKLAALAREHSKYMIKEGKLSHDNFHQRVAYYTPRGGAFENVAFTSRQQNIAHQMVDMWINSPGHRANMLGESLIDKRTGRAIDFIYCGIGIEKGPNDYWYATQIFSRSP